MFRQISLATEHRVAVVLTPVLFLTAFGAVSLQAQDTVLKGVVKNASGEPVAGALVKVTNEELGLGFMAVSQAQGRYTTPGLRPGKYTVQGFGGSFQTAAPATVTVGAQAAQMDLALTAALQIPKRPKRMTDDDYVKLLPAGPMKAVVAECTQCHSFLDVVSARKTREQWSRSYHRMFEDMYDIRKVFIYHGSSDDSEPDKVIDYLAKSFGPDTPPNPKVVEQWLIRAGGPSHPNRNLPANLLQGAAAKYVSMEFALPSGAQPHDVAVDSQGIAWVTERNTGMLGRFDPRTAAYTRIPVPPGKDPKFQLNAVAIDPQDRVWFVDDGPNARIVGYDPKTKGFDSFAMPEYPYPVSDIGWGRTQTLRFRDGSVWATGITSSRILRLDPSKRKMIDYPIPRGALPFGMAIGGENTIWYSTRLTNLFVRLDPNDGRIANHYPPIQDVAGGLARADLRGMAADSEGNLWAGATETGKLVKLDYHTGYFTEFKPPTEDAGLYSVDVDTTRNLIWFNEIYSDKLGRFDPKTNTFVEYPLPIADSDVRRIEVDRSHPNRVWWSANRRDKIGYVEVVE